MQRSDPETARLSPLGIELHCPRCHAPLAMSGANGDRDERALRCERCEQWYPIRHGVPLLCVAGEDRQQASRRAVGETVDRFERLLADSDGDVEAALRQWTRWLGLSARDARMMMGSAAAGWRPLAPPLDGQTRVLEIGCGWGALTASLARDAGSVMAVDWDADRLRFARLWIERLAPRPVGFVCLRGAERLPFADAQFDWVVLNGATGAPLLRGGNVPEAGAAAALLGEACRVLRGDGTLLLADDNRRRCFRPAPPEDPAFVAKQAAAAANNDKTRRGAMWRQYVGWIEQVGLRSRQSFFVLPDRHVPGALWRSETAHATIAASFQRACSSRWRRWRHWARGWRYALCPPAFLFRASTAPVLPPSVIEQALEAVATRVWGGTPGDVGLQLTSYRINCDMGMVTAVCRSRAGAAGQPGCVLRLPLEARAEQHARTEFERLRAAQSEERWEPLAGRMPPALHEGTLGRSHFTAVGLLPGRSVEQAPCSDAHWRRALAEAAALGVTLHRQTCGAAGSSRALADRVVDEQARLADLTHTPAQRAALMRLGDGICRRLDELRLPSVMGHGDFKLQNCLFDLDTMRLTGVIDWGASQAVELPLYDLSFLYVDYLALRYGRHVAAVLRDWLAGQRADDLTAWLAQRAEEVGLTWSDELNELLAHYQWLERMAPLTTGNEMARFDAAYVDRMFDALPRT